MTSQHLIVLGIGLAAGGFATLLLPGIVSLSGMLAAIQGVTLPLVLDLGYAREIDDRLLTPDQGRRRGAR